MSAYPDAIEQTTPEKTPWFVVLADDKPSMRDCINLLLVNALKEVSCSFPKSLRRLSF